MGFDEPITVHRLLASRSVPSRSVVSVRSPAPIGRAREAAALLGQWRAVLESGTPQAVLLSGEPGLGKWRQVQALKQGLRGQCQVFEGFCFPRHRNTVLFPLVQALESEARLALLQHPSHKAARLAEFVAALGLEPELVSLLAPVLGLPLPDGLSPSLLTPLLKRQRTMQALMSLACALVKRAPLLFLVEDRRHAAFGARAGTLAGRASHSLDEHATAVA